MKGKQPHRKRIPQRMCVVCRRKMDKRQLYRLVRTPEDGLVVDLSGKRQGRGAYICDQTTCWDTSIRTKILDKTFEISVSDIEKASLATHRPK